MARPSNPNSTHISVKLTPGEREAVENYRWDPSRRLEVSGVIRLALNKFFESEGIKVVEPGADAPKVPADDAEAPGEKVAKSTK